MKDVDRCIDKLRQIGYPCAKWTSASGRREGIVIGPQAAARLIQVHQPGFSLNPDEHPEATHG